MPSRLLSRRCLSRQSCLLFVYIRNISQVWAGTFPRRQTSFAWSIMLLPRKRKRRAEDGDSNTSRNSKRGKGPTGRPLKRKNELAVPRDKIRQQQKILYEQTQGDASHAPQPTLSVFEKLPTELIQHIFFEALEPSLAITSTILNQVLSSESVFRSLLLLAFYYPYNYGGEISKVDEKVFLPAQYQFLDNDERMRLQQVITRFRWCNLARIRGIVPTLSRLVARASYEQEKREFQSWGSEPRDWYEFVSFPELPDAALDDDALQERYSARQHCRAYQLLEKDRGRPLAAQSGDEDTMPFLRVPRHARLPARPNQWHLTIACPVLGVLSIPGNLLRGNPWTSDALAMLRLLRQGLRAVQHHQRSSPGIFSVPVTDMFEGIANAIREQNRIALVTLLELLRGIDSLVHAGWRWDTGVEELAFVPPSGGRFTTVLKLNAALFHLATKLGDRSAEFLRLLIRADMTSIPEDDKILTSWALRAKTAGSDLGGWLLQWMAVDRQDSSLNNPGSMPFQDGKVPGEDLTDDDQGGLPFYEEIGYICGPISTAVRRQYLNASESGS